MENYDFYKKSILKKSDLTLNKKEKKVTFCSTVKLFIDDNNLDKKTKIVDPQSNCIEVNIVDKSSDDSVVSTDDSKHDECNATDFLVHKVIYDNPLEHDEDAETDTQSEEADEHLIMFENSADDEALQFVVHKVTDHEDDLIQQELDFEDNDINIDYSEEVGDKDIVGKLSELSIENILTHDKIIAFIDQNTISLSSLLKSHVNSSDVPPLIKDPAKDVAVSSNLKHTELVLSPPLQELSLDKIVKAQSDSVLCELDISPLNSIQETDSDSDVSSEGTMIMMTTEESEKNEQHIRESFLKYETKKKEKVQTQEPIASSETIFKNKNESVSDMPCRTLKIVDFSDTSSVISPEKPNDNCLLDSICIDSSLCLKPSTSPEKLESNSSEFNILPSSEKTSRISSSTCSYSLVLDEKSKDLCVQEMQKKSYKTSKDLYYLDEKSLASVKIPKDVRVWKVSSPERNAKANYVDVNSDSVTLHDKFLPRRLNFDSDLCDTTETSQGVKTDELESFVNASRERVQRIRKRYLGKTQRTLGSSNSPVRGIRPRFGSTAEILQLVQKKSQPPLTSFIPRSQVVSWPCVDSFSNSEIHNHSRQQLIHMLGCQTLPGEYSLPSYHSYVSEDSSSSTCDYDSVSSCPSIFFHERGVPEGASPPMSLSDDSIEQCSNEENINSVVYFSMKV